VDWTLTSALGVVATLAIAVGYEFSVIPRYSPEPAKKHQAAPILIPAPERGEFNRSRGWICSAGDRAAIIQHW
jgi:hypothetical protein